MDKQEGQANGNGNAFSCRICMSWPSFWRSTAFVILQRQHRSSSIRINKDFVLVIDWLTHLDQLGFQWWDIAPPTAPPTALTTPPSPPPPPPFFRVSSFE
ncbi:hypothetical protein KR009_011409 [Drosophila setifemur]|nr:hypothetical protein KR009_011409 [Drosophila setifemur]